MAPLPVPASTATRPRARSPGVVAARRRASASATPATCSDSGRGIRTRGSTSRSSVRKGQCPKTYWRGSPAARRAAMARAAATAASESGPVGGPGCPRTSPSPSTSSTMKRASCGAPTTSASSATRAPRVSPSRQRHPPPSSSPASCRARLSAIRASVSSVRSPASTWSSLYSVRLIRWSVTRFSLKL